MGVPNAPPAARSDEKGSERPKAELDELGADRWELVTTVEYTGGGTKFLLFKRPAGEDESV